MVFFLRFEGFSRACLVVLVPTLNRAEYAFATCLELLGSVFGAILVGNILGIISSLDQSSAKQRERVEGTRTLMILFPIPMPLRRRLRKWAVRQSRYVSCLCDDSFGYRLCAWACLGVRVSVRGLLRACACVFGVPACVFRELSCDIVSFPCSWLALAA